MESDFSEVSFYVKGTDCSNNSRLSTAVFMGDLQEAADTGAADTGFDRFLIEKFNACWIILRMRVHIIDMPKWRDTFKVRTWSTGCDKFFFDREFEVFNSNGDVIAMASSIWIMAEIDTHRPIIPSRIEGISKFDGQGDRLVFGTKAAKAKIPSLEEGVSPVVSKFADYSELDWNGHVNNTRYIAWICDAMYKAGANPGDIEDLTINYISEVKEGEKVDIYLTENEGIYTVYGYKNGDNGVFTAQISLCK